jgi:hypothetical protein
MVVAEHDLHGAAHVGVAAELGKVRHHHIRGQWHIALACHGGHAVQARGRVLVVLEHAAQLLHDLQAGFHGPVAIRVDAQRCAGEGLGQRQDAGSFLLGGSVPALSLMLWKPYWSIMRRAWATSWAGVRASPQASGA